MVTKPVISRTRAEKSPRLEKMSNAPSADNQVAAAALKIGVGDENNEPIKDQKTKYQNNVEINRKVEFWQQQCLKNGVNVSDMDPKEHDCFAPNDDTAR